MALRRLGVLVAFIAVVAPLAREAVGDLGRKLWVDGGNAACSDAYSRQEAASAATPWCSIVRAAALATAGDTVAIRPGRYVGSVRPASSDTTYTAVSEGVVVDAASAPAGVKLASVSNVTLQGIAVTGAAVEGISASRVER